jgi:hypothetical protein
VAAASATPSTDTSYARCGAKTRSGRACVYSAGRGTDHLGYGNCHLHGGASPSGIKHAANIAARHLAIEVDMEPHDALLWCVRVAAGEVAFFTRKISELEEQQLVVQQATTKSKMLRVGAEDDVEDSGELLGVEELERTESTAAHLHIWVEGRAHAVDRLAKFAKMALDAGVEERRVRLAETLSSELSDLFAAVFAELGLTPDQLKRAKPIVHRQLVMLEGGGTAA